MWAGAGVAGAGDTVGVATGQGWGSAGAIPCAGVAGADLATAAGADTGAGRTGTGLSDTGRGTGWAGPRGCGTDDTGGTADAGSDARATQRTCTGTVTGGGVTVRGAGSQTSSPRWPSSTASMASTPHQG